MNAMAGKTTQILGVLVLIAVCCGVAVGQEGIARISEFTGDVHIQRGEEIIQPVQVGKMIRNGSLIDADMVQTKKGTASVLFEDGSILKLSEETLIVINPPEAKVQTAAQQKVVERRIRIVVGKVWNFIEPKSTGKTMFELPDGVAAVRGCSSQFTVSWNGSYSLNVGEGTYMPQDFLGGVGWQQNAGSNVRVIRVPGGIRIVNGKNSAHALSLNFLIKGKFQIVASGGPLQLLDADGNTVNLGDGQGGSFNLFGGAIQSLPPGASITIIMKTKRRFTGQLAGLAPFRHRFENTMPWQVAVAGPGGGGLWPTGPIHVNDFRRDAHFRNNLLKRSVFNRKLNRGHIRDGGAPPCSGSSQTEIIGFGRKTTTTTDRP
ncbi:MAG: FecR domain-containing protein [Planctomycetes bacterium]|nr:FecR domain-containing protein [Planctomycetota bacterium]